MRTHTWFILLAGLTSCMASLSAQSLQGYVLDYVRHTPLPYATVRVLDTDYATVCDSAGQFELELPPGLYNVEASYLGYQTLVKYEVSTQVSKPTDLLFELKELSTALQTVEVLAEAYSHRPSGPLALQNIALHELENSPGAVLDLSRFVKTLPGFSPKVSFGYNLIVRGGAAFENSFYIDGVKLPAITHFTVQGTSGGPQGLLNILTLRKAEVQSTAFSEARGHALSSVMELYARKGRRDRFGGSLLLGATDWGFMLEGPMGKKSSFLFSARESFAQHAFKAIGIPVLPAYSDVQYHQNIQFDLQNSLQITGVAAYDKYTLNLDAEPTPALLYNIGYIPEGKQFLYAAGATYRHHLEKSVYSLTLSRNFFYNFAEKYADNSYVEEDLLRRYRSAIAENHFNLAYKEYGNRRDFSFGLETRFDQANISEYHLFAYRLPAPDTTQFDHAINLFHYALFGSYTYYALDRKLRTHLGLRMDGNNYSSQTSNPLRQISPRLSVSWQLNHAWTLSGHTGLYYQMPPHILLVFQAAPTHGSQEPETKRESLRYIRSLHAGAGIEHTTASGYRLRFEGFYKKYSHYPMLLRDSISFANAQADYVVIGDQPANADSKGRVYGMEFQVKQKLRKSIYWTLSFTWLRSQFTNADGAYASSSWDNRYFSNLIIGKRFGKNWQIGAHWVIAGGSPYTPYDLELSAFRQIWDVNRRGIPDYNRINEERLRPFHQLNLRLDKQFDFRKWTLSLFLDLQNVYAAPIPTIPYLSPARDENQLGPDGYPALIVDPQDPNKYQVEIIDNATGRVLPALGIIADF
ncbi:MAG TPA: TonB-dependent receptor [Phaeodactylibacter sp.]|nr:TonB-dependent receptor [Phaeodactylibacter sp.]